MSRVTNLMIANSQKKVNYFHEKCQSHSIVGFLGMLAKVSRCGDRFYSSGVWIAGIGEVENIAYQGRIEWLCFLRKRALTDKSMCAKIERE